MRTDISRLRILVCHTFKTPTVLTKGKTFCRRLLFEVWMREPTSQTTEQTTTAIQVLKFTPNHQRSNQTSTCCRKTSSQNDSGCRVDWWSFGVFYEIITADILFCHEIVWKRFADHQILQAKHFENLQRGWTGGTGPAETRTRSKMHSLRLRQILWGFDWSTFQNENADGYFVNLVKLLGQNWKAHKEEGG